MWPFKKKPEPPKFYIEDCHGVHFEGNTVNGKPAGIEVGPGVTDLVIEGEAQADSGNGRD